MLKNGPWWVAGTMSGTSLDGVDVALLQTDGERILAFGEGGVRPYRTEERAVLRAALGQWQGPEVEAAAELVTRVHAEALEGVRADLIGFHGQTLAHEPKGRGTLQAGDGAALAEATGLPVAWDFRSADVQMGGEGAPLAPFYHFALAKHLGAEAPLAFLNLGGVGNLTWIDPRRARPEEAGALLAFDTGPANAPVDDLVAERLGQGFDEGGALAARGEVDEAVLEALLAHRYFARMPPKSLDRNAFDLDVRHLGDADAAATLTACAAAAVMQGMDFCPEPPERLLVTGGGRKNETLMAMIAAGLDCPVEPVEAAGLDGDLLEAQAFAYLAARVARGLPTSCPGTTGVAAAVGGGILSRPQA
ncbi:anhydro-N-acetylmuramic acid kinase [Pseudoroseicyclus tamaricis]|uniref:Anhydro-N-acetylmuramic acid kinase n=1 Tax=Pseudoroseicyclus tamaricis TaxID=2705421 RepID=A0A6B2JYM9_9RHOB|nr:anhydro-N-acetylmuramic acid kinase [Pseudoroseicyclus tamaricis]NDV01719.1 anhydro-N-acetylmuramic acid kinase [Pseudoroseicyclus tamaricis]